MRVIGLILCMIGTVVAALGSTRFFGADGGFDGVYSVLAIIIAVVGLGAFALGVMVYLIDFLVRIFRRRDSFRVLIHYRIPGIEIYREFGTPVDEDFQLEDMP